MIDRNNDLNLDKHRDIPRIKMTYRNCCEVASKKADKEKFCEKFDIIFLAEMILYSIFDIRGFNLLRKDIGAE